MKNFEFKKENIKNIFFLGFSPSLNELVKINEDLKIKSFVVCLVC